MKVAIVAQPWDTIGIPFRQGSTIAIVARNLAAGLPAGSETWLFSGRASGQAPREAAGDGLEVLRYPSIGKPIYQALDRVTGFWDLEPPFFASRRYYGSYYRRVSRALADIEPDIVLLFTFFQFAPLLRAHLPRARIVLRMADDRLGTMQPRPEYLAALQSVDFVVGNSNYTIGRIRGNLPAIAPKCRTLYNGVDADFFTPQLRARAGAQAKVVLFVGRVSPEKGLHVLIEAFDRVLESHPDCELHICGQPGLLPYSYLVGLSSDPIDQGLKRFYGRTLAEKIRRQLLQKSSSYVDDLRALLNARTAERVRFFGPVPYAELPQIYASATVFVIPSVVNEPFGNPLAEAMACGLPIVATNGGGFRELIEHERSGLLVARNDAGELTQGLTRLLGDPAGAQRLGAAARARIAGLFTWRHSAAALLELALDR